MTTLESAPPVVPCPKCGKSGEYVYGETKTGVVHGFRNLRVQGGFWVRYRCSACDHDWTISGSLPPV